MGILYTVWPLDAQARAWLRSQEIVFPDHPARWPTRSELRAALDQISGFEIEYTENGLGRRWDASISDKAPGDAECWTLLHAEPQDGDDECTHVHFEKGEPLLIAAILRGLSRVIGPMILLPDIGVPPMVVCWQATIPAIVDGFCDVESNIVQWEKVRRGVPGAGALH